MTGLELSVAPIVDRNLWDNFVESQAPDSFMHTWQWGIFQEALGGKIWRLGIFDNHQLVGIALIVKVTARRGSFLFCPHGPLLQFSHERQLPLFVAYLANLAKLEGVSFIRISPLLENTTEHLSLFHRLGFRNAPIHMHAELMWLLDLTPSEDTLLLGMRKTTRQLIHKAERDGVLITTSVDPQRVDDFWAVYQQTVDRQGFVPFSREYLKQEFTAFVTDGQALLFFAQYQGVVLATALVIFANGTAFYHHGASTREFPKIPAAHLLQWAIIQEAKKRGCRCYNFWGIAPENTPSHPWAGLTLFKMGFGGFAKEYLHAQDLVLTWRYWPNYVIEKLRKARRHL